MSTAQGTVRLSRITYLLESVIHHIHYIHHPIRGYLLGNKICTIGDRILVFVHRTEYHPHSLDHNPNLACSPPPPQRTECSEFRHGRSEFRSICLNCCNAHRICRTLCGLEHCLSHMLCPKHTVSKHTSTTPGPGSGQSPRKNSRPTIDSYFIQGIAPALILFRVAQGRAWSQNTANVTISSASGRNRSIPLSDLTVTANGAESQNGRQGLKVNMTTDTITEWDAGKASV